MNTISYERIIHPISPVYDENSRILILGSFPSVKSREQSFFYGHPQNRFWKVLAGVFTLPVPISIEEKKSLLMSKNVALWDVIYSCEIIGSSDSSIRAPQPTELNVIIDNSKITQVFANGKTAGRMYERYQKKATGLDITVLPSTSPANASFTLEQLLEKWTVICSAIEK